MSGDTVGDGTVRSTRLRALACIITNLPLRSRVLSTVHTHANTDDHALSEISHPGAVQTLHAPASRHPCMCFSLNRAPVVCESGTWNPTRKAHSLTQRRSASTSAGVWDFMARIARAPRPTQLKPRLYHLTPPFLMSLCPASSLTRTDGASGHELGAFCPVLRPRKAACRREPRAPYPQVRVANARSGPVGARLTSSTPFVASALGSTSLSQKPTCAVRQGRERG